MSESPDADPIGAGFQKVCQFIEVNRCRLVAFHPELAIDQDAPTPGVG